MSVPVLKQPAVAPGSMDSEAASDEARLDPVERYGTCSFEQLLESVLAGIEMTIGLPRPLHPWRQCHRAIELESKRHPLHCKVRWGCRWTGEAGQRTRQLTERHDPVKGNAPTSEGLETLKSQRTGSQHAGTATLIEDGHSFGVGASRADRPVALRPG